MSGHKVICDAEFARDSASLAVYSTNYEDLLWAMIEINEVHAKDG